MQPKSPRSSPKERNARKGCRKGRGTTCLAARRPRCAAPQATPRPGHSSHRVRGPSAFPPRGTCPRPGRPRSPAPLPLFLPHPPALSPTSWGCLRRPGPARPPLPPCPAEGRNRRSAPSETQARLAGRGRRRAAPRPRRPRPYLHVPAAAGQEAARHGRVAAGDGGELGAQHLLPLGDVQRLLILILILLPPLPLPLRRLRARRWPGRLLHGCGGRRREAPPARVAVPGRVGGGRRGGSMGLTMETLKEAMKYMLESQGFDRVLRKVRALGGQGSGSAAPAARLICAAFCAPRSKGLKRDQGHPRPRPGGAGVSRMPALGTVAVLLTRGRKHNCSINNNNSTVTR